MIRERPILFSAPMVRAILAGTKTQTRRIVKNQSEVSDLCGGGVEPAVWWPRRPGDGDPRASPYGMRGDRLWIRETWARLTGNGHRIVYRADGEEQRSGWDDKPERRPPMKWQPSIFLTRQHSRIQLEVLDVRVERLLDIGEDDARAEGIEVRHEGCWSHPYTGDVTGRPAAHSFLVLWNEINGKRAPWSSNPWVFVIAFRRIAQ